jgi:uncharacterized membrane protein
MSRAAYALIAAVIGAALALLDHAFLAKLGYVPQTHPEWFSFYFWLCVPWAVLGAIIGYVLGGRRSAKS